MKKASKMKIPKEQLKELLDSLELKLLPFTEDMEQIKSCTGGWLLSQGINQCPDKDGKMIPVVRGVDYVYSETRKTPVNHRARMKTIIRDAKNMDDVLNKLAAYQARFGNPALFKNQSKN